MTASRGDDGTGSPPPEPAGTAGAYDAIADHYDRGLGFRSRRFADRLQATVVALLKPAAGGARALELGAGTGWMLATVAPLFHELVAVEASRGMLAACRRRIEADGLRTVRAEPGDAATLDGIGDGTVDAVYGIGLLDAVADPGRVLAASARVLAPGGVAVFATANGACPWFRVRDRLFGRQAVRTGRYLTAGELIGLAEDAGLRPVEVRIWGAAPPGLTIGPVVRGLETLEGLAGRVGLSRYLGVITAAFQKPASNDRRQAGRA